MAVIYPNMGGGFMGRTIKLSVVAFFALGLIFGAVGCGGVGGTGPIITSTIPTYIFASWSGGAAGEPNDRTDEEATEWDGQICPASSILLDNYGGEFAGLHIVNNCAITVTLHSCATKGSPQPGLEECATDPFQTPYTDLDHRTINPGALGDFINTNQALSINIFYCSDEMQLNITTPLRCIGF
jgi:hypothetical protein